MKRELEHRYRALLACYPRRFRAEHEEAMVDCFAQSATASQRWPSLRETASLLTGALRARGRERIGSTSQQAVWASGLRVGAFLALGVQMAICVQRWNYDWSREAVFITTNPQSQIMNLVWTSALVAALPSGRRVRSAAVSLTAVLAYVAVLYSFPAQFPSPFFMHGLWLLLPVVAGLLVPAHLILRSRHRLDEHNTWTLPLALIGPVPVALAVVAASPSAIDTVQVIPYLTLITVAVALSPFDPRLAVATTVAILPLALLVIGQELQTSPGIDYSLDPADPTQLLIAVAPVALVALVAINRSRAWDRLHAS